MDNNTRKTGVFQMAWIIGSVSLLLFIGADGLALFAQQGLGQENVVTLLLALHLASWLYVLGIIGLILLPVWWFVSWWRTQATVNRFSPTERKRWHPETPELEGPQFLQRDAAPVVTDRFPRQSDDRITSSARVA